MQYRSARLQREGQEILIIIPKKYSWSCCLEPKWRGGRCDNCGLWYDDVGVPMRTSRTPKGETVTE